MKTTTLTRIIAGTMCISLNACRGDIHKVAHKTHFPIVARVDSFAKSTINNIDTTGLELFKVDTIHINNAKLNSPVELAKKLQEKAVSNAAAKKVLVDSHIGYGYGFKVTGGHGFGLVRKNEYESKYLIKSAKAVMQNMVFANRHENEFYVPVSYYAKKNPKLEKK